MRLSPFALVLLALACGESKPAAPQPRVDAGARRVPPPPREPIFAFPPHAIRSDGVGPYRLGDGLMDVLKALPEGPRMELLQLGKAAAWKLVRAEDGKILIGFDDENRVGFVAVLAPGIARTTGGIEVGATGAALAEQLGAPALRTGVVVDREVYEFASLPGVRFVTGDPAGTLPGTARVTAVVVTRRADEAPGPVSPGERERACREGGALAGAREEIAQVARKPGAPAPRGAAPPVLFACVTVAAPEAVTLAGGELVVVAGEPGKLRRVAALPSAARAALPLDVEGDGRDELVLVAVPPGAVERAVELRVVRWEGGRFQDVVAARPYVIGQATALGAGVTPSQIDFAVEVSAAGGLKAGGLYLTRDGAGARDVIPLAPVPLRAAGRTRPAQVPVDAGAPARDGGVP